MRGFRLSGPLTVSVALLVGANRKDGSSVKLVHNSGADCAIDLLRPNLKPGQSLAIGLGARRRAAERLTHHA